VSVDATTPATNARLTRPQRKSCENRDQ
jgi:hypothetical protein